MKFTTVLGMAVVAIAAQTIAAPAVQAAEYHQNASGTCKGSMPIYDQALHYRPLALANTSSQGTFVTCTSENLLGNSLSAYGAYFENTSASTVTVSCTFIAGRDSFAKASFPKSMVLTAGQRKLLAWNATSDNGGVNFRDLGNLSCSLPPGVEIEYIGQTTIAPK